MSKGQPGDGTQGNRLLGAIEAASLARIVPHLEPVVLKLGAVVCEAGGLLKHAYFPQGAVLSLLTKIAHLDSEHPTINCTTCHRGQKKPALNMPGTMPPAGAPQGH